MFLYKIYLLFRAEANPHRAMIIREHDNSVYLLMGSLAAALYRRYINYLPLVLAFPDLIKTKFSHWKQPICHELPINCS